ncbi:MAG: methyltransferase domain-containing protein [Ignavibacteria bacterium]|nr:methyltransferase domain-containing protein [Ignavibacteria bacterium]
MNLTDLEKINTGFGNMADEYDSMQDTNIPVKKMRKKFYKTVESFVKPPASLLELNCGTGIDAFYFANAGYNVTATDISDKMLMNARSKGTLKNLSFEKLNLTELNKAAGKYDLVISNLGGLNCLNDLSKLSRNVSELLNPKGFFIVSVMPQFCLWEFALIFKGEFKRALRRLKRDGVIANMGGEKIFVRYYSPKKFYNYFKNNFHLRKTTGLCIFAPPQPASHWYQKHPSITKFLDSIDDKIESFFFSSFIGDYYIAVLQKV